MVKSSFRFLVFVCLLCGLCWAADDPFVGNWKLDSSKSRLIDQMKVGAVGGDKFSFMFDGTNSETIAPDGTDQPGLSGTTFSVSIQDAHTWKVERKQDGHELLTAIWKLSEDGNTLRDAFTTPQPDGSRSTQNLVYKRTAGTAGFAGTWERPIEEAIPEFEMQIQLYENNGLSFIITGKTKNLKFDGKDYANPSIAPDYTSSGHRADEHTLELTDKIKGKVVNTRELKLSSDRKTLTMTLHLVSKSSSDIYVFSRQ